MRQQYIDLVKEYIRLRGDFPTNLKEVKENCLQAGVTEEEFITALQFVNGEQNTGASSFAIKKKEPNKFSFSKKFILIDILCNIVFLLLFIVGFTFYNSYTHSLPKPQASSKQVHLPEEKIATPKVSEKKTTENKPLYTMSNEINVDKTFSYQFPKITINTTTAPKREVFGFFPYWMLNQEEKVNIQGVTTIALFALEMDGKGNVVTKRSGDDQDPGWTMWNNPRLMDFIKRGKQNKSTVVLTLKSFRNDNIEEICLSDDAQKTFITNALYLVNSKSLEGINIDFEYIGTPSPSVRDGFTKLITNLNIELKRQIPKSSLTIDTYVHSASSVSLFDLTALKDQVNAFVIMGYDFHTPSGGAGPVAPLEGGYSLKSFLKSYLEVLPPDKIILALPYYGYEWPVTNGKGAGGTLSYAEVAQASKTYTVSWDENTATPWYTYSGDNGQQRIVYFDNVRSMGLKYDYINAVDLQGVGIWALGFDGLNGDMQQLLFEKFAK